jgi:integrase/recombinase XerD
MMAVNPSPQGGCTMKTLKQRMQEDLQLRRLSPRTQKTYLSHVTRFARHFNKLPDKLGEKEVKEYLLYLISKHVSYSILAQTYSALKFIYEVTLKRSWEVERIPYPKTPWRLPVVLDRTEIATLFSAPAPLKYRTIFMMTYSAGLRVSEVISLKIDDIDTARMMVRIRQGKGGRDRYSLLSKVALEELTRYRDHYQPHIWLFPGMNPEKPLSVTSVQKMFQVIRNRGGITKPATVHTLRHSFATHLLEGGCDLHRVQLLLGHKSPVTTTVYLHLSRKDLVDVISPLDML